MRTFIISVDINAEPTRVWAVMSDIERWHEWTPSVTKITKREESPLGVGSSAVIVQPRFPPALWRITELDAGRSFTWVSIAPGLQVTATHWVEPNGTGTRAHLTLKLRGLFSPFMGWITGAITRKYLEFEADGLKRRSETPAYQHSAGR